MADRCYNTYSFYGNEEAIKKVKEWKALLDSAKPTDEDQYCAKVVRQVFYADLATDQEIEMGSKWVHQDDDSIDADDDQIGFLSAWSPPNELQKRMACMLYILDKHIVVRNSFNIEGAIYGISYSTPYDSEKAYFDIAEIDIDSFDDCDDREEAEEMAFERLDDLEKELLGDMVSDVEGTSDVIKKFMPNLKFDWEDDE
jgi:hypothetical protein